MLRWIHASAADSSLETDPNYIISVYYLSITQLLNFKITVSRCVASNDTMTDFLTMTY
jgi:hypothetical protein